MSKRGEVQIKVIKKSTQPGPNKERKHFTDLPINKKTSFKVTRLRNYKNSKRKGNLRNRGYGKRRIN